MAATIAVAGQKGGTGKSTTALSLAAEFLARGLRVLVVDADTQGTVRTWAQVATEAGHPAPTVVAMGSDLFKPHQLPTLAPSFDVVLIDTPPRLADVQRAALAAADLALLPCGPSASDAWALAESAEMVREAQRVRPSLRVAVLLTRQIAGTNLGKSARGVLEGAGLPVLSSSLGFRVAFQEAPGAGRGPAQHDPSSDAAAEVRALADEVSKLLGVKTPTPRRKKA